MRETGWLIELNHPRHRTPSWLWLGQYVFWTKDSNVALRFARKLDAEAYLNHHQIPASLPAVTVTEHVWEDGAGRQQSPAQPEGGK